MLAKLYRSCVPASLRKQIYDLFLGEVMLSLRRFRRWSRGGFVLVFSPFFPKNDYYDAFRFVGRHGETSYPFFGSLKYRGIKAPIFHDDTNGLPYCFHHERKLFFPRAYNDKYIQKVYRHLLIEQDKESPHRYFAEETTVKGKTLLDIGAAEGIFSLDHIDDFDQIYLFECEKEWIEALEATFAPWKHKVEIVEVYVGGVDGEQTTTIDSFLQDKEKDQLYIKMDIEGAEPDALKGAEKLLQENQSVKLSVCLYHKQEDEQIIMTYLTKQGYTCEVTTGYLYYQSAMRRAICRAEKSIGE